MTNRILDLSEDGAELRVSNSLLLIRRKGEKEITVPLVDLAVVIISHPAVMLSHAVISGLCSNGAMLIACDEKHLPSGMTLPLQGHGTQSEIFRKQALAPLPLQKRLWKEIVKSKICAQGRLLKKIRGEDKGLLEMAKKVKSGDPQNLEAQAARRYWPAIFGNAEFHRNREAEDHNRHLNYGYAVLRAITARAICSAGLHPTLGFHHHNRYDAFCLADDLMEPLRPIVDETVLRMISVSGENLDLNREAKRALLGAITSRFVFAGEERTLFDGISRIATALADIYRGHERELVYPDS